MRQEAHSETNLHFLPQLICQYCASTSADYPSQNTGVRHVHGKKDYVGGNTEIEKKCVFRAAEHVHKLQKGRLSASM